MLGQKKRVALYLRVSTSEQTTDNQRMELNRASKRRGWRVVEIYEDHGIRGAKARSKRPAFAKMLRDATHHRFDIIAAWSVDRLGRSLQDLVTFLNEINALELDLYLHQQALDTTTPVGRAMFNVCGVFSKFERAMIQDRVKAGLARARAEGKRLGRPPHGVKMELKIKRLYTKGMGNVQNWKDSWHRHERSSTHFRQLLSRVCMYTL
jgi:DNA invertase Pin-like site-specific DNA recombinase